jgi:uncharacterized protein YukE
MPPIHVNPDQLYLSARRLWQDHLNMVEEIYLLRTAVARLEMAWHGPASDEFASEMNNLIKLLNEHADELMSLGLTLSHQGEMWDESDQRWTWNYRNTPR